MASSSLNWNGGSASETMNEKLPSQLQASSSFGFSGKQRVVSQLMAVPLSGFDDASSETSASSQDSSYYSDTPVASPTASATNSYTTAIMNTKGGDCADSPNSYKRMVRDLLAKINNLESETSMIRSELSVKTTEIEAGTSELERKVESSEEQVMEASAKITNFEERFHSHRKRLSDFSYQYDQTLQELAETCAKSTASRERVEGLPGIVTKAAAMPEEEKPPKKASRGRARTRNLKGLFTKVERASVVSKVPDIGGETSFTAQDFDLISAFGDGRDRETSRERSQSTLLSSGSRESIHSSGDVEDDLSYEDMNDGPRRPARRNTTRSSSGLDSSNHTVVSLEDVDIFSSLDLPDMDEDSLDDASVESGPYMFTDVDDIQLKGQSAILFNKLNVKPSDGSFDDYQIRKFLMRYPRTCKVKFNFSHFEGVFLPPLTMLCVLGATVETLEVVTKFYPSAMREIDSWLGTPLHYAVGHGNVRPDIISFLADTRPEMLAAKNSSGQTPLHVACARRAHYKIVSLLFQKNRKVATITDKQGRTPYKVAIEVRASSNIIELLSSVSLPTSGGATKIDGMVGEAVPASFTKSKTTRRGVQRRASLAL